jgi:DNA-binding NarL/FixJ family response regulator
VIRVLLADDNEFVRTALVELFNSSGDMEVVAQCSDGDQVPAAAQQSKPDVVILDLAMPGRTGLEAARDLLSVDPAARIVLLTGNRSAATLNEAHGIGLVGYLLKGEDPAELLGHVRTVAAGGTAWSADITTDGDPPRVSEMRNSRGSDYRERRLGISAAVNAAL